jgi:hypothetical protein
LAHDHNSQATKEPEVFLKNLEVHEVTNPFTFDTHVPTPRHHVAAYGLPDAVTPLSIPIRI